MLPIERKSVEPMAARLAPGNVRQMHQGAGGSPQFDAPEIPELYRFVARLNRFEHIHNGGPLNG